MFMDTKQLAAPAVASAERLQKAYPPLQRPAPGDRYSSLRTPKRQLPRPSFPLLPMRRAAILTCYLRAGKTLAVGLLVANALPYANARLYSDPLALQVDKAYDYIIVGASPGGCVLARRLTEDTRTNVLLIEAGPDDAGQLPLEIPFLASQLQPNTAFDWNYTTVPQPGLGGRVVTYPRGRVLGGSTSINFMIYTRGSADDFDKFAELSGDSGWSWNAMQPYFRKLENLVPPVDGHNTSGMIDPSVHGMSGPLNISLPGAPLPPDPRIQATTEQLRDDFPFNEDMNSGNPLGIGWLQGTFGGGIRASASAAYLRPLLESANLDVLVNTTVIKLIQTGAGDDKPTFRGVQCAQSRSARRFSLNARKEVILAAGAINTPQLLMLSGLGSSHALHSLGVQPVLDLPDVGQHLADHPLLMNQYAVVRGADDVFDNVARNATLANSLVEQWLTERKGIMASVGQNHVGWLRLPANDSAFATQADPSAGPLSPHYEFLFAPGFVSSIAPSPDTGFFMTFFTAVVTPTSRGSVTLASSDPFAAPVIDPNFLSTPFDIAAMRSAVRSVVRFASAATWRGFLSGPAGDFAAVNTSSDDELDTWARGQTSTIWHPVGTARMGKCDDTSGSVVNPDLTMKGIGGLRIVDASVLPFIPAAHPQAAIYALAERVADLIKSEQSTCNAIPSPSPRPRPSCHHRHHHSEPQLPE
ncbi:aryl-alcohol-oxidase from pleurotus Eryingii [Pilatotrama ljubarskyi]|nr:aryl-alcohol-oxidase from pleurotus Eryingii [Pilatotrama ljubarskyi]